MDAVIRFAAWSRIALALASVTSATACMKSFRADKVSAQPDSSLIPPAPVDDPVPGTTTARPQAPAEPAGPIAVPSGPIGTPVPWTVPTTPVATAPTNVVAASFPGATEGTTQIRVVALIGSDIVITDDEVWQMVRQRAGDYIRLAGTERTNKENEIFREELRKLIERELILSDFIGKIKKNKPTVLEELREESARSAQKQVREFKKANKFPSEDAFTEALRSQGLSIKALTRQLERNAMMNIYLGQFLKEKGKGASLADLQRYYAAHPDEFSTEDRVKWLDLFVSFRYFENTVAARQHAEALVAQARGGADFAKLVSDHGHGDSKLRGGEGIGAKKGEIQPREVEATVFALKPGQVGDVIATETGFHIVKVLEREVAGTRPFDEKTQMFIRGKLAAMIQKTEYEKLIDDLWRKTTVKVIDVP